VITVPNYSTYNSTAHSTPDTPHLPKISNTYIFLLAETPRSKQTGTVLPVPGVETGNLGGDLCAENRGGAMCMSVHPLLQDGRPSHQSPFRLPPYVVDRTPYTYSKYVITFPGGWHVQYGVPV